MSDHSQSSRQRTSAASSEQHRTGFQNAGGNSGSFRLIGSQTHGGVDVLFGRRNNQLGESHLAIQGLSDAAAEEFSGECDHRRSDGEGFVAGVAAAEVERVEDDVGVGKQIQELGAGHRRKKADSGRTARQRLFKSLLQTIRPVRHAAFEQYDLGLRIAAKNSRQHFVKVGMEFEQRLRAEVGVK